MYKRTTSILFLIILFSFSSSYSYELLEKADKKIDSNQFKDATLLIKRALKEDLNEKDLSQSFVLAREILLRTQGNIPLTIDEDLPLGLKNIIFRIKRMYRRPSITLDHKYSISIETRSLKNIKIKDIYLSKSRKIVGKKLLVQEDILFDSNNGIGSTRKSKDLSQEINIFKVSKWLKSIGTRFFQSNDLYNLKITLQTGEVINRSFISVDQTPAIDNRIFVIGETAFPLGPVVFPIENFKSLYYKKAPVGERKLHSLINWHSPDGGSHTLLNEISAPKDKIEFTFDEVGDYRFGVEYREQTKSGSVTISREYQNIIRFFVKND
jgi:hypothetical protein